jgi:hypothetical protein
MEMMGFCCKGFSRYFSVILLLSVGWWIGSPVVVAADTEFVIRGRVLDEMGTAVSGAAVVLLRIRMSDGPTIEPVEETVSAADGSFRLTVPSPVEGLHFRVESTINGRTAGTNPFRFTPGQTDIWLEIGFERVLSGAEHLNYVMNILVFDRLEGAVRVTEIINLENPTDSGVDVREKPLRKRIPTDAVNFQYFRQDDDIEAATVPGEVRFRTLIPPGRYQLFFSYDLPAAGSTINFDHQLPSAVKTLEVLHTDQRLSVRLEEGPGLRLLERRERNMGNRRYQSQQVAIGEGTASIGIRIDGLLLSQRRVQYPVMILGVLLLAGLLFFLVRVPQPASGFRR